MFFPFKVYVGCCLTTAPEEFKEMVERLKARLRTICEVLCFIGKHGGAPGEIYRHDIDGCIRQCDLFVAICDFPSTGLGYELGTQVEALEKQTLAVADKKREADISWLLLGIQEDHPEFEFRWYEEDLVEEVFAMVQAKLKRMSQALPAA